MSQMSTTLPAPTPLLSVAGFVRFTPEQYHKLGDAGVIMEGEPIELLEGYLVAKAARKPAHDASLRRITARIPRHLPAGWFPQTQCAVALGESEPEPDAAILRGDVSDYDARLPVAGDVGIVIEVSDSSLAFDRRDTDRIYARAGIPVYWVVNVIDRVVEVYTDPDPAADPPLYRTRTDYHPGDTVPIVLDGSAAGGIPVADVIP